MNRTRNFLLILLHKVVCRVVSVTFSYLV
jgi:hypothetical protein